MSAASASRNGPTWRESLLWALAMGGLFFLVYGSVNAYAATRTGLPSLYLPWEVRMPFIPWLVVPYMSLDLLFVLAFLLCCDRQALATLIARIGFALVISAGCFLLFPMRFAFERPAVDGLPGLLFDVLALDYPYNQCPSLHISLGLIVWRIYEQATEGVLRFAVRVWFVLIGVSTLFVYQHHAIDLPAGVLVAILSTVFVPSVSSDGPFFKPTATHRRLALRYLGLTSSAVLLACLLQGLGWLLLYPALSCLLVSVAYAHGDAGFLRKTHGRHPWPTKLLFAPYLIGAWLVWWLYRGADQPWQQVAPNVWLGSRLTDKDARLLMRHDVGAVLDLTPELAEPGVLTQLPYLHVPMLDLAPAQPGQIESAVRFIETHATRHAVYVHCALGYYRSAAVVAAYLVRQGQTAEQAVKIIQAKRPRILMPHGLRELLERHENHPEGPSCPPRPALTEAS